MAKAIPESSLAWMPKSIWGPLKWRELHVRSMMDFPMKDQFTWFNSFVNSIPCPKCQEHFEEYIKKSPPELLSNQEAFFEWTVEAHNHVNKSLGKPQVSSIEVLIEISQTLSKNP